MRTPRRIRIVNDDKIVGWACEFPDGTVGASGRSLFRTYPNLDSFKADMRAALMTVQFVDNPDHYITISEDQHRGGAWVIEHGDACRVKGEMGHCMFTAFARDHINGSRIYPTGRFLMHDDDGYIALSAVRD